MNLSKNNAIMLLFGLYISVMTKFNEFDESQKEVLKEFLILELGNKIKDDREYIGHIFRFLIYGNGSGIILLATFMGAIAANGHPISQLVSPLWKFLFGSISGALIYATLATLASQAIVFHYEQAIQFLKNEIEFEDKKSWVLTNRGITFVQITMLCSAIFFIWGVIDCISILKTF